MYVELDNVVLISLNVESDFMRVMEDPSPEEMVVGIKTELHVENETAAHCNLILDISPKSQKVKIEIVYAGFFNILNPEEGLLSEENASIRRNLAVLCTVAIFPYARELLADITRRMAMTPIELDPKKASYEILLRHMENAEEEPKQKRNRKKIK